MPRDHLDPTPVQTMPVDIIRVVFEMLRDIYARTEYEPASLCWIPEVTHVCRSWREAALSTSILWTNIDVPASIPWALEFARRSGNAPICIFMRKKHRDLHPRFYESLKILLHENRQRVRKVSFGDLVDHEEEIIRALSDDTGTGVAFYAILEDIEITFNIANLTSPFLLADNMLRAPKLKRLSLKNCFVDVKFASLHNISHLSISGSCCLSPFISPKCLCNVLLQTPNLETLVLSHTFLPIPNDPGTQSVVLPKLLNLQIWGLDIKWVSALLQAISNGPHTKVFVEVEDFGFEETLSSFSCLISHAVGSSDIGLLDLSIVPSSVRGLRLDIFRGESSDPDISLNLPNYHPHPQRFGPVPHVLDGLLHRMNYQGLRALVLKFEETLPSRMWVELFGALPSLDTIAIFCGERELFGALVDDYGDQPAHPEHTSTMLSMGSDPAALPFQALKTILVARRSQLYSEEDIVFMLKCLRMRFDMGIGLEMLCFGLYGIEGLISQVSLLKDVVGSMKVDFEH